MSTPLTIREDIYSLLDGAISGTARIIKQEIETPDPTSRHLLELQINGDPWMNNRVAEGNSHADLYAAASGAVLLVGLGLGCDVLLLKDKTTTLDVVEINQDVIDLVAAKVGASVTLADFYSWQGIGHTYDLIWIDIFQDDIDLHPVEKALLENKAAGMLKEGGTVMFWRQPTTEVS